MEPVPTAVAAFDAKPYELEDSAVLIVQDASGTEDMIGADGKNPVTIQVFGPGSKQGVRAQHVGGRHAALRMAAMVRGKVSKSAAQEAEDERIEKLAMITGEVTNFPYDGGPAAMYANPKLCYVAKQVEDFFGDNANFAKPSSANSPSTSDSAPG